MPSRTVLRAALAAVALLGAAPAAAFAGTTTIEGGALVFRAAPGEANDLFVNREDDTIVVDDAVAMTNGAPGACSRGEFDPPGRLRCPWPAGGARVELGDGDDHLRVGFSWPGDVPVTADGGPGNDALGGGAGPDTFHGGDGSDVLEGNQGADHLFGDAGADDVDGDDGPDEVRGGDGDDVVAGGGLAGFADVIDGGAGRDTLSEYEYTAQGGADQPVRITLAGGADDGRPGENDDVQGVEVVHLLVAADVTAGADPVDLQVFRTAAAPSRLVGSPGADLLTGFDYDDVITGAAGDDVIVGGYGHDTIVPGPGRDTVNADTATACNFFECRPAYGNDTIDVRDGEGDTVSCGVGQDRVLADAVDVVAADCETVERPTGGGDGGKTGGDGGKTGGGKATTPKKLAVTVPAKLKASAVRAGTRLSVAVPKAGRVTLTLTSGKGRKARKVATGSATAKAPGTIKVRLKALKAQRSRVRRGTFRLTATLRPKSGKATTVARTVKVR